MENYGEYMEIHGYEQNTANIYKLQTINDLKLFAHFLQCVTAISCLRKC